MGNTRSWPEREACKETPASPSTLSEREAFDIAVSWHGALSSFMLPDVASHYRRTDIDDGKSATSATHDPSADDFTVVDHLEWIEFDLRQTSGGDYRDIIAAARASTLAWFALACCPGFGAHENPVFWKRVFSAFMRADTTDNRGCHRSAGVVTDRVRFFEHADRPFPSVRFAWFKGFPLPLLWQTKLPARDEQQLSRVMQRLEPFICPTRSQRAIAVSIRMNNSNDVVELTWRLRSMDLAPHLAGSDASKLQLTTVYCNSSGFSITLADAIARFPHARVCVVKNDMMWSPRHALYAPPVASVLVNSSGKLECVSHVDIQMLDLWVRRGDHMLNTKEMVASWCSLMPHMSTVASVGFTHLAEMRELRDVYTAWLGYALFHPDCASVENLTFRVTHQHRSIVRALERMRQGNNLLFGCVDGFTEPIVGYHKARMRSGAIVWATANNGMDEQRLYEFPSEGWITLCVSDQRGVSIGVATAWVRAVLPGYGHAWILSSDILEVVCRPAAPSRVRRLRLLCFNHGLEDPGELDSETLATMLDVLSIFGVALTYLHIETPRGVYLGTEAMHSVLRLCPNIISLRVPHDGSYWVDQSASSDFNGDDDTRLQELELSITETFQPFSAAKLHDLRVLSISCARPASFVAHRSAVLAILFRYPWLSYINWHYFNASKHCNDTRVGYDAHRDEMVRLLASSVAPVEELYMAAVAFRLDARLAFLSVVAHHAQTDSTSLLAKLPQDALVLIFRFSTSLARRHVYIRD